MRRIRVQRRIKRVLSNLLNPMRVAYLSIGSTKKCPICGWTGHAFLRRSFPNKPAASSICPSCGSSERHRYAYYALKDRLASCADSTLHFAPEKFIEPWLRSISSDYLSVDLMSPQAMRLMDITDLQLEDESFSLVWCSHVLEHIENDRKAMTELFRVSRTGGMTLVMVPIYGASTFEDPQVTTPADRLKHFKQEDHVRLYGLDITNRLADVGFEVEVLSVDGLSAEEVARYALEYPSTREIFICTRP